MTQAYARAPCDRRASGIASAHRPPRVRRARPLIGVEHAYADKTVRLDVWRVEDWSGVPHGREGQERHSRSLDGMANRVNVRYTKIGRAHV